MIVIETQGLQFECGDAIERWRAETLWTKEPGTIRWLQALTPGDVFYDVGANIGLYTILAARHVGPTGHVYAFEPHAANALSLLRNVALNKLQKVVTVVRQPLNSSDGVACFHYRDLRAGSSGSQLLHHHGEDGVEFTPVATELVACVTIDGLLKRQAIKPAALVKIDVDGNEDLVLEGMRTWLNRSTTRPRSIQIETRATNKADILARLGHASYHLAERHDTAHGAKQLAAGADPESLTYNLVFEKGHA